MLQSEDDQATGPDEHSCQLGDGELLLYYCFRHIKKKKADKLHSEGRLGN